MVDNQKENYVTEQSFVAFKELMLSKFDNNDKLKDLELRELRKDISEIKDSLNNVATTFKTFSEDLHNSVRINIDSKIEEKMQKKENEWSETFDKKLPKKVTEILEVRLGKLTSKFVITIITLSLISILMLGINSYIQTNSKEQVNNERTK